MTDKDTAPLAPVSLDEFEPTSYETWKEAAVASLKGAPFEKKLFTKTYEGITLEPIYTKAHVEKYAKRLSFPGAEDFLRGTHAGGYLSEPWTIAQDAQVSDPKEANAILKLAVEKGANALTFDAQKYQTADAFAALLKDICLSKNALNVYAGAEALSALKALKDSGKDIDGCFGCVGADPIGEYALTGKACCKEAMGKLAEAYQFAKANMPKVKTIMVNGTIYHNGGATAVQEVAAAMATAAAYLEALTEAGISIDEAAKTIRFKFALGANFFMEIAKLRAARVIWSQIVKAYGGSEEAQKIDISAETSKFFQTKYDPYVNILRATTQTFSGVVGGVNEMTVLPFDNAVRKGDDLSHRIARNIQIMMQEEFELLSPVDPAGGSWYVETLTGQLADAIWNKFEDIQGKGGMIAVLECGCFQDEVAAVLDERFKNLAFRKDRAVGTNMYANMTEVPLEGEPVDSCCCCDKDAVIKTIKPHRWTEQYEAMREASEKAAAAGKTVKVFLCNMGPVSQHKARADFAGSFMEVGKFEVLRNNGFATTDEAIAAAKDSGADIAIICSTDDTYPELVPVLAKGIKAAAPGMSVMVAGAAPAELKAEWDAAGVDEYVNVKSNCLAILTAIQKERGIC